MVRHHPVVRQHQEMLILCDIVFNVWLYMNTMAIPDACL